MGVVYLAEDPLLHRQVAIKMVDLAVEDEEERNVLRDRLIKNARAAAALSHAGIVSVHDVVREGDRAYLVMEYVAGESLSAILKKTQRPEPALTLRVLREMAAALDYTHAKGIVHRDIKPANVMIDAAGAAKIMDFGIARIADGSTRTMTGMVMGTVQYMAPEQVKGESVDGRADQFALAAVAYEMLTGATLFGQHTLTTLAYKIVNEAPVPVRERNASIPPAVDAAMARALSKSPHDRYATCGMFVAALERAFAGVPAAIEAPTVEMSPIATTPPPPRARRTPLLAGVVGAVVLIGGVLAWHPWSQPAQTERPAPASPTAAVEPPAVAPPPAQPPPADTPAATPSTPKQAAARPTPTPAAAADRDDQSEPMPDNGPQPSHPAADALADARQFNQKGQTQAALDAVNKAIALNPQYGVALVLRGELHQKQQQWDAAFADYTAALNIFPKHAHTLTQRGVVLVQLHRDDEALKDFTKALGIRPDLFAAHNQRGLIYLRRKEYPEAIADFTESIRLAPNAPMAYQNRANARRSSGDRAGAREDMKKFQELKPQGNEYER
jgi:serine/threonine protein kinase/Tfp pilus assembly protein PilF